MRLITREIETALLSAKRDQDPAETPIVVKFFCPDGAATWFIVDGEQTEDGDWMLFGFCDLGDRQMAELGYVSLRELTNVRGALGLPVERDLYFPYGSQ